MGILKPTSRNFGRKSAHACLLTRTFSGWLPGTLQHDAAWSLVARLVVTFVLHLRSRLIRATPPPLPAVFREQCSFCGRCVNIVPRTPSVSSPKHLLLRDCPRMPGGSDLLSTLYALRSANYPHTGSVLALLYGNAYQKRSQLE